MRVELLEPEGTLTIDQCHDVLSLVVPEAELPPRSYIGRWTPLDVQVVYDWAMREYLIASDNRIQRRSKPFALGSFRENDVAALWRVLAVRDEWILELQAIVQVAKGRLDEATAKIAALEEQLDQMQAQIEDQVH